MWHDPPRLKRTGPLNVVYDGNSLFWGEGSTGGRTVAAQALPLLQARFADVAAVNLGVSGQTWRQMDGLDGGSTADVDSAFLIGRTNVLVAWETTNAVIVGRSGAQAAADCATYLANRLALHPDWRIVLLTTLPRQAGLGWTGSDQGQVDSYNAQIEAADALMRANYRAWGARACVDVRCAGSPFRFADYAVQRFAADPQLWNEAAGGRVHLTNAGYAVIAGLVARAILALPAR